jgi:two-component system chemotaxis sensor kinase CheA
MSNSNRLQNLLKALGTEVGLAKPGSTQSQFPILDILGNLRDIAGTTGDLAPLGQECAQAWERLVLIVESGRAFSEEEVQWLQALLAGVGALAPGNGSAAAASVAPVSPPAPIPAAAPPAAAAPADAPEGTTFMPNLAEDIDLLREFVNESREHLDNIEQGVLVLEHRPTDAEMLHTIFRAFHTFKGSAGTLSLMPINRLAHALESLLDLAREGRLFIDRAIIELILRGRDVLQAAVEEIDSQLTGAKPPVPIELKVGTLKSEVMAVVDWATKAPARPAPAAAPAAPAATPPAPRVEPAPSAPISVAAQAPEAELEPIATPVATAPTATEKAAPAPLPGEAAAGKTTERGGVVKVDTTKLDMLLDLVGEMVIAQSLVTQDLGGLANLPPQFARNLAQLSRTTKELQRVSMTLRMVPIRGAFQKMARVVRDISARQKKTVQLVTTGEDTELDRGMVEELNDPLLHMVRNSIDHGIETAETRAARGKPQMATVHLRAFHQGGNIVLEIEDDGAGLNRDKILAKAIAQGLTTADHQHTDEEIFHFIFAPGFSTADKVTDISGRGVGLDVVRRNIERLRGCVDIASTPGQGTRFKITLPLTLAIIDGLIVKVGEERYIVPTLSVRESFRAKPEMITTVQGVGEVVNVRGRLLPLLRLYNCFGVPPTSTDPTQGIILVAQAGTTCKCLLVDSLLHKQEVVIKNLNELMIHKNRALAGAAILGDGRVGLILDVNALVQQEQQGFSQAA